MDRMIVVTRNGKTTVLTGWKAWAVGLLAVVATWAVLGLIAFLVVGVGLTVGLLLLLAIPAIGGVGLVTSLFRRP